MARGGVPGSSRYSRLGFPDSTPTYTMRLPSGNQRGWRRSTREVDGKVHGCPAPVGITSMTSGLATCVTSAHLPSGDRDVPMPLPSQMGSEPSVARR
jgi:hypothetical protein